MKDTPMKKKTKPVTAASPPVRLARKRVTFSTKASPGASVFLAGCFNDWNCQSKPMKDKNGDGIFTAICYLPAGTYEYKFYIDGVWCTDCDNPNVIGTPLNTLNSVIEVK
jgi:1,4-alpha-glucan branching enzyme